MNMPFLKTPTQRDFLLGLLFVSPWLIGFLLCTVYPLIASLYYSFTRYDLLRPAMWIGFGNYIELFTSDSTFPVVISNTLYYVLLSAPLGVVSAFLMASLLRDSDNWQKGMPLGVYMKSMWRHFMDVWSIWRGVYATPTMETALCALLFNVMGMLHVVLSSRRKPANTWLYSKPWSQIEGM